MKQSAELVFIPTPGIGHIVSTVEVAKLLLSRDDKLFITVLIMKFPQGLDGTDAYIKSVVDSSISHRIKFINLPQQNMDTQGNSMINFLNFIESHQTHVKEAVDKLTNNTRLAGFVIDMFCTSMIDVANELGVPTYLFFSSGAAMLGLTLHLQALRDDHNKHCIELKDSTAELVTPSYANPLPAAKVLPGILFDEEAGNKFLNHAKRFRDVKGILINTFTELESHAILSLSSDGQIPPVYPVGPLLNVNSKGNSNDDQVDSKQSQQKSDILKWLDDQPPSSIVFLCFGSMGSFNEDQVKEIARALEHGGFRFLWSLRQPPPKGNGSDLPTDYADYTTVLPEGFLDRTAGIGKVIGWAPQVAVLAHPAVGGFVSHCGWNSTLESLWFGVPVATWPLYAEQQANAFELVTELGIAVEIDMGYRKDAPVIVSAEKIERGIKELMELDSEVRKRVKQLSDTSKKALMDVGSSYASLGHFIDQI